MNSRTLGRIFSIIFVVGLVLGATGCKKQEEPFEVYPQPPQASLQRHWQLPDFALVERSGKTLGSADLRGKVWVADFFYSSCPGPCPMLSSQLSDIYKSTRTMDGVTLVSISTDPIKDTPEVLTKYAEKFGAMENWWFLTGDKTAIYELANKGFKIGVTEDPGALKESITHSTKLVLVDKNGMVRGFYNGLEAAEGKRLIGDIETLRKETR